MPQKRLHRSRTEKMIAGVCGGIAEYFDIDPTIVRILWVLMAFLAGAGVLLYVILWIIMPLDIPAPPGPPQEPYSPPPYSPPPGTPPDRY